VTKAWPVVADSVAECSQFWGTLQMRLQCDHLTDLPLLRGFRDALVYLPDFVAYLVTGVHCLRHPTFNVFLSPNLREYLTVICLGEIVEVVD
jgi:hypothetical protein